MKNTKLLSLFLATIMIISCFSCITVFSASPSNGTTFKASDVYSTKSAISKYPVTVEATVYFPSSTTSDTRGGVIIGNYKTNSAQCFSFEIHKNGNPRLYFIDNSKTVFDYKFTNINVYNGKSTHIAITADSTNNTVTCYIDGVAKQTLTKKLPTEITISNVMCLGGDLRTSNTQYFKGSIKNIALFSDVRSAAEIEADAKSTATTIAKDNLIGFYDLSSSSTEYADKSGSNGPTFATKSNTTQTPATTNYWYNNPSPAKDYAYSFVVVGDTQKLVYMYPEKISTLYSWIENNLESKNIKYVIGLGDITDKDETTEWNNVMRQLQNLKNKVPFSLVRGNHDSVEKFNKYFPYSQYKNTVSGSYDETMLNTYHKFTVGNINYLLVNLDMGPSDDVLEWANQVVSENPDYNVIVATHVYLYHDGTTLDKNDNAPATKCGGYNNGDDIWNKFVRKHENIVLVLSGHDPYDQIITSTAKGDNGNTVTQMLIDPQSTDRDKGGLGLVAMLYFSEDGKEIQVEYISTAYEKYFMKENQFSLTLDVNESAYLPDEDDTSEKNDQTDISEQQDTNDDTTSQDSGQSKNFAIWLLLIIPVAFGIAVAAYFLFIKKETK